MGRLMARLTQRGRDPWLVVEQAGRAAAEEPAETDVMGNPVELDRSLLAMGYWRRGPWLQRGDDLVARVEARTDRLDHGQYRAVLYPRRGGVWLEVTRRERGRTETVLERDCPGLAAARQRLEAAGYELVHGWQDGPAGTLTARVERTRW